MAVPVITIVPGFGFNFEECLWFLNRNYDDCMHKIIGKSLYKALSINEVPFLLRISQRKNNLEIEILEGLLTDETELFVRNYFVEWFDLDRNLQPFYALLNSDEKLSYMATEFNGLRMIGIPDLFEALCWSIIGQQINLTFAYKLKRRLVEKYGSYIERDNQVFHIFPSYETLADADPEILRSMQLSTKKTEYIIGIAKEFAAGKLSKEILLALPNLEARQKMLMSIKGIGIWTANYALMKSLKEQSSVPYGDAGLVQALLLLKIIEDKKDIAPIHDFFERLGGWESYMVFYLWRTLSKKIIAIE